MLEKLLYGCLLLFGWTGQKGRFSQFLAHLKEKDRQPEVVVPVFAICLFFESYSLVCWFVSLVNLKEVPANRNRL
jgi:hypothetical protein